MRKWIIGIVFIFVLLLAGIYLLVPAKPVVTHLAVVNATAKSIYRSLTDATMIQKWWGDSSLAPTPARNNEFAAAGFNYHFKPLMYNGVEVTISKGSSTWPSVMSIASVVQDSSLVEWKAEWPATSNPLQRLQHYWQAKKVKQQMGEVMQQFAAFMNRKENVYGLNIVRAKVTDTVILTHKRVLKDFPTPVVYYGMIQELEQYLATTGVQATNYPMLNISAINEEEIGVMVGIPISKAVTEKAPFQIKRMIPGNILVAEVTGGNHTVVTALQEMQNYVQENGLLPPAIPYQQLVTNRLAVQDTTKWVTKLYFPIY